MKRISVALIIAMLSLIPFSAMAEHTAYEDSRADYFAAAAFFRGEAERLRGWNGPYHGKQELVLELLADIYDDLALAKVALADGVGTAREKEQVSTYEDLLMQEDMFWEMWEGEAK